jgi:hypothetical protein
MFRWFAAWEVTGKVSVGKAGMAICRQQVDL